jgi:hypothetical protein
VPRNVQTVPGIVRAIKPGKARGGVKGVHIQHAAGMGGHDKPAA